MSRKPEAPVPNDAAALAAPRVISLTADLSDFTTDQAHVVQLETVSPAGKESGTMIHELRPGETDETALSRAA